MQSDKNLPSENMAITYTKRTERSTFVA